MCFKHKRMKQRAARSAALTKGSAAQPEKQPAAGTIPPWGELVKLKSEAVAALVQAHGIESTGSLMGDKSALHKAR